MLNWAQTYLRRSVVYQPVSSGHLLSDVQSAPIASGRALGCPLRRDGGQVIGDVQNKRPLRAAQLNQRFRSGAVQGVGGELGRDDRHPLSQVVPFLAGNQRLRVGR